MAILPKFVGWHLFLVVGAVLGSTAEADDNGARPKPDRPNFVLLLIDDLGWTDLGCCGSTFYETPHVDRLAAGGVRFTDAYAACAVCSPTRASIMTGKHPARLHLTNWLPGVEPDMDLPLETPEWTRHVPLEEVTIAEALGRAGYVSAATGKWHLGGPEFYPERQGFGLNVAGSDQGSPGGYFYPYEGYWRPRADSPRSEWVLRRTIEGGRPGEYLTDRLTDEAVRFIEESRGRPFFLYLSHYAVHTPIQAKKELAAKYRDKPRGDSPHGHPGYAAMIESVDQSVGRVLETLDRLGLDGRTVVIFFSDNGGLAKVTSNAPLRAGKVYYYEGGIRVPLIVRWPGHTKPGTTCGVSVMSTDLYPTMLEMAELDLLPEQHRDGVSLVPLLDGTGPIDREALYWHYPHYNDRLDRGNARAMVRPCGAIRQGDWKLIEHFEDGRVELYNLADDLGEQNDLARKLPDKARSLQKKLAEWRKAVGAQMPTKAK